MVLLDPKVINKSIDPVPGCPCPLIIVNTVFFGALFNLLFDIWNLTYQLRFMYL